jgi:hypothetical protein
MSAGQRTESDYTTIVVKSRGCGIWTAAPGGCRELSGILFKVRSLSARYYVDWLDRC